MPPLGVHIAVGSDFEQALKVVALELAEYFDQRRIGGQCAKLEYAIVSGVDDVEVVGGVEREPRWGRIP